MKEGDAGFVRADQIDLKSLDEQLERHLTRAWTMEKREEEEQQQQQHRRHQRREDWEIDPARLVVRSVIARGTFGTVHRGVYDGHDVADMHILLLNDVCPQACQQAFTHFSNPDGFHHFGIPELYTCIAQQKPSI